ncbi:MAG: protein kinase [Luteococcus sp.]|uniref:serine/threonine-protein kinase n=1 Tax=Luteococcus sp. TaxID=1969402 RepID=UPI0026476EE2|nr:serine/threonine-protein kinase [Luteococcus sp.]MDN5564186.1 protein kinase [Luteococcus sp.]
MTQEYRPLGSKYRLMERIGQGAMGEVWRGLDAEDCPVAVKLLLPHLANDPAMVQRFVAERSVLTGVKHRNVVQIRDMVVEGSDLAIVMEYVPGSDLRGLLQQEGSLPPAVVAHVGQAVAQGLGAIHRAGVYHRDVKPENVLMAGGAGLASVPKLTDFGISRLTPPSAAQASTMVVGTPYYMAPELADGSLPTARSDLYALGAMLYELCCGVTPFQGRSPLAVMKAHATLLPGRPDQVPDELWEVISRLLAKDPAQRPASDAEVVGLLAPMVSSLDGLPAAPQLAEPPAGTPTEHTGTTVLPAAAAAGAAAASGATRIAPAQHTDTVLTPPGWNPAVPGAAGNPVISGGQFGYLAGQPGMSQPGMSQPGMSGFPLGAQTGFPTGGQPPGPGSSGIGWGYGPMGATVAPPPPKKRGGLVALALLPLIAVAVAGVWYLAGGQEESAAPAAPVATQQPSGQATVTQPAATQPVATVTAQSTVVAQSTVTAQATVTVQQQQEQAPVTETAPVGQWLVVLESLEKSKYSYADAGAKAAGLTTSGATVHVLDSDTTPGLHSGYWVLSVYPFGSRDDATAMCEQLGRSAGGKCYPRFVG